MPTKDRRHARQIVGREGEDRLRLDLRQTDETFLAQTTNGLTPAEYFFDQLLMF
jgi:hypothetical protein